MRGRFDQTRLSGLWMWLAVLIGAAVIGDASAFLSSAPLLPRRTPVARLQLRDVRARVGLRAASLLSLAMDAGREGDTPRMSEADFAGLLRRVSEAKDHVSEIPCVILDSILPRQCLSFETVDPIFRKMIESIQEKAGPGGEFGCFGMLGVDVQRQAMLRCGTEVVISELNMTDHCVKIKVQGSRRFWLVGDPWNDDQGGFYVTRVEYVDGEDDDSREVLDSEEQSRETAAALAEQVAEADAEVNVAMAQELEPLVETWKRLVVDGKRERQPDQIKTVLQDLGPMPPAEEPRNRALWVAALINPLPALGVSLEIRPAVLSAPTTAAALEAVMHGIKTSIAHLDGSEPMW